MKERWYEAHMDIEMIDQVDIGNKHCALQNVTSPAIPMQQAHWQDELRKSRNAVRDRRFGTVIMDFSFNSSTRTRQAKRSTLSSVQPHLLLLEPIDQQVAAASPLLLSSLKSGTPSSHGMSGIVMNVPLISSIQEGELKKSTYKFFLRSLTYQLQCPELLGKATLACSQVALELCRESSTSDKPADIDSISAGMFGARPNLSSRHNEPETISHWPDAQHGLKTVYCPPTTLM